MPELMATKQGKHSTGLDTSHKCTGSEAHTCHPYLFLVPSKVQQDAGDKPAWNAQPRLDAQVCLRQTPQLTNGPISCTIICRVSENIIHKCTMAAAATA